MLELTRRMNPSRSCFDRIAGAYINGAGEVDETFNVHFGNLSASDKAKNLELAKAVPFSRTNDQLKEYTFPITSKGKDRINAVKYRLRLAVYFPFQFLIALIYMPFILVGFAAMWSEGLAFDYTYMTERNPIVNQNGPTRMRMKKHCFLVRFIFCLISEISGGQRRF